jgi:hypothetical protein
LALQVFLVQYRGIKALFPVLSLKNVVSATTALHSQQTLDTSVIRLVNDNRVTEVALGFFRFGSCNVAQPRVVALDFSRASHLETLLGAGVGLHFRHDKKIFSKRSAKIASANDLSKELCENYPGMKVQMKSPSGLNRTGQDL